MMMGEKEMLKVVADKAADRLKEMSASVHGLTANLTGLRDAVRTHTNVHNFYCGQVTSGRRTYSFEIWLDKFVSFAEEKTDAPSHFWYGINASAESLALIIEHLPNHLQPVAEFGQSDIKRRGGFNFMPDALPLRHAGKVTLEKVVGSNYLGVYEPSVRRSTAELQALGEKAADFWRQALAALNDMAHVDELILEGQEVTRTGTARNRSAKLRARALAHFHPLRCQACGFSTRKDSGLKNREIIEFHHKKPVSWNDVKGDKKSLGRALASLVSLCPTCHRIAHSAPVVSKKLFALADIRKIKRAGDEGAPQRLAR
jgi:hypothetical protein